MITKSARSEFYKLVKKCQSNVNSGNYTEYDEVIVKVGEYLNALELERCVDRMEKEFFHTKNLTKEEQLRVVAVLLQNERNEEDE